MLVQVSKAKAEKAAVEEELKAARHAHVAERSRGVVSQRDVALAADDRVHDAEIAMKLVRQRLHPMLAAERGPPGPAARPACPNGLEEAAQRGGPNGAELQNGARTTVWENGSGSTPYPTRDASPPTWRHDCQSAIRNTFARGETSGVCPDGPSFVSDHRSPRHTGAEANASRHRDEFASFEPERPSPLPHERDAVTSSSWLGGSSRA